MKLVCDRLRLLVTKSEHQLLTDGIYWAAVLTISRSGKDNCYIRIRKGL